MHRVGTVEAMRKYALGDHCAYFPWKETTSKRVYIFRNLQNRPRFKKIIQEKQKSLATALNKNKNIACGRYAF